MEKKLLLFFSLVMLLLYVHKIERSKFLFDIIFLLSCLNYPNFKNWLLDKKSELTSEMVACHNDDHAQSMLKPLVAFYRQTKIPLASVLKVKRVLEKIGGVSYFVLHISSKFPLTPMGVLAHHLRTLERSLVPPSA